MFVAYSKHAVSGNAGFRIRNKNTPTRMRWVTPERALIEIGGPAERANCSVGKGLRLGFITPLCYSITYKIFTRNKYEIGVFLIYIFSGLIDFLVLIVGL